MNVLYNHLSPFFKIITLYHYVFISSTKLLIKSYLYKLNQKRVQLGLDLNKNSLNMTRLTNLPFHLPPCFACAPKRKLFKDYSRSLFIPLPYFNIAYMCILLQQLSQLIQLKYFNAGIPSISVAHASPETTNYSHRTTPGLYNTALPCSKGYIIKAQDALMKRPCQLI